MVSSILDDDRLAVNELDDIASVQVKYGMTRGAGGNLDAVGYPVILSDEPILIYHADDRGVAVLIIETTDAVLMLFYAKLQWRY